jgi:hypothetical protein
MCTNPGGFAGSDPVNGSRRQHGRAFTRGFEGQHADSGELKGWPIGPEHSRHTAKTAMTNHSQQIVQKLWK